LEPSVDCSWGYPVRTPIIRSWVGTGSKTFTVEYVENFTTALTQSDISFRLTYLGTANSLATAYAEGGDPNPETGTAATSSTVSWTGAAGYTKGKMVETVTVNKAGIYAVQVYLAKYEAGKDMYVCPLVDVT
jgi:hypothetical protein